MERVTDEQLLERYVATFEKLDEMIVDESSVPFSMEPISVGEKDEYGCWEWKPSSLRRRSHFYRKFTLSCLITSVFHRSLSNCSALTAGLKSI